MNTDIVLQEQAERAEFLATDRHGLNTDFVVGEESMDNSEYDPRTWFHKDYKPTWKLHQFTHPVWLVEFIFDDTGPTETEFEPVFKLTGSDLGLTREEFAFRMDGCCGYSTGQPFTASQVKYLQDAGIRMSLTEVGPIHHLIHSDTSYYYIEDPALREELADWMLGQGAEIEVKTIE
jgi:hypothetical protein